MLRAAVKPDRDPRRTRSTQEPPSSQPIGPRRTSTPRAAYHRAPRTSQGCERRPGPGLSATQSSTVISDSPASSMCLRTGGCTNDDGPARSRAPYPPAGAPRATQSDASPVTNDQPSLVAVAAAGELLLRTGRGPKRKLGRGDREWPGDHLRISGGASRTGRDADPQRGAGHVFRFSATGRCGGSSAFAGDDAGISRGARSA
jgi:hypothetical protein